MPTRKYADTFLFTLQKVVILPRNTIFKIKKLVLADVPSCSELPYGNILVAYTKYLNLLFLSIFFTQYINLTFSLKLNMIDAVFVHGGLQ